MRTLATLAALLCLLLTDVAGAQQTLPPTRAPGPARHAGIYHVATGTWTRTAGSFASIGPDVIYRNDAPSGYYLGFNAPAESTDEGEIPTIGAPFGADRDEYAVNCFEIGYCADQAHAITFSFYSGYVPCDDVLAPANCLSPAASMFVSGMPGGPTGLACWNVVVDLTGGAEFCLQGDGGSCNAGFQNDTDLDSFGFGIAHTGLPGSNAGPMLAGDPDWTYTAPGAAWWGGGGTYYDMNQAACSLDTGLNTQDLFYATDTVGLAPGCYWFGGYQSGSGCGNPTWTPFSSFHLVVLAAPKNCVPGGGGTASVCNPAANHSQGGPASMDGSNFNGPGAVHLECTSGPPGEFGYFLVSKILVDPGVPVSSGLLCLGTPQSRYNPGTASSSGNPGFNSLGQFDANGVLQNIVSTSTVGSGFDVPSVLPPPVGGAVQPGDTCFFQCWYRDGAASNFSNVVQVTAP